MSEQETQNENMETGETSSSQQSSNNPSQSAQSGYAGRSNLRSRWKRKSGEPVAKPGTSEGQFSYGAIENPAEVKETVSGKDAFSRPVASNGKVEVAPVEEVAEEVSEVEESTQFESSRPSYGSAHPSSESKCPSFEPRRIERTRREEPAESESNAEEELSASTKKSHERFEDYEPDANDEEEDYTLDYSKQAAVKKPQRPQSSQYSSKFGKGSSEALSSQKFEKSEGNKDRFQSQAKGHEKHSHAAPSASKKGLLGKIGGFFASILGKKEEQPKGRSDERSWQKHRHEGGSKSSQGGQRGSRHHKRGSSGGGGSGGTGGGRSRGGYNRNRGRGGSIKG